MLNFADFKPMMDWAHVSKHASRLSVPGLNAMQNLAALAAAASAAQSTPTGSSALTTSSSPLSVLTSSGMAQRQHPSSLKPTFLG